MDEMTFGLGSQSGPGLRIAQAALISIAVSSSAAPALTQENANTVSSMLGFFSGEPGKDKDQDSIDYHARPPLVVPPRYELPQPKEVTRDPSWPKDPDAAAERRAALDSRRPAPQTAPGPKDGSPQGDVQEHKAELPSDGPADECQAGSGVALCLSTPFRVLKSIVTGFHSDPVQPGAEPPRKYLTEPPPGYRQAVGTAKASTEAKASAEAPAAKADPASTAAGLSSQPR
jgi:hypothetical protein